MRNKILITGATGSLGSKVVELLKQKTDVANLSVLVRDQNSEPAQRYFQAGIEVKIGDYANAESLANAFKDVAVLYFVSGGSDDQRTKLHENVVDNAKEAGLSHIVYTSGVRKDETDSAPLASLMDSHIQTENFIKASGIAYTILRHNLYAEVIEMMIGDKNQLLKTKTIFLPAANGLAAFVPKKDLAEAAVAILLTPSDYENKTLEFNGSELISFLGIAQKLSEITAEPIRYISPDVTEFESEMSKFGLPDHAIGILSSFSSAIANGEFDQQSGDLETVFGRRTQPLTEFLTSVFQ